MIVQTLTGVVVIAVLTQIAKALLEAAGISQDVTWHDPLIWLFALMLGGGGYVLWAALSAPLTGDVVKAALGQGFEAAVMAIGTYHLVTHEFFGFGPPPEPEPAPPQPPGTTA